MNVAPAPRGITLEVQSILDFLFEGWPIHLFADFRRVSLSGAHLEKLSGF